MAPLMNPSDELDQRLRAARPDSLDVEDGAFDATLLARVRAQPIERRRAIPRRVGIPVAAGATAAVAATAVALIGSPGGGGPSSAQAVTQALRWFDPPPGTVLHVRSVETRSKGATITRELWEDSDHPADTRMKVEGATTYEQGADSFYDPSTDTIYERQPEPAGPESEAVLEQGGVGDPAVQKTRVLLARGNMTVTGREMHDGVDAWRIALKADFGRPVWMLWIAAADGRPLELYDPGRDASEGTQVIRWPTYEVLSGSDSTHVLSLTAAHPNARVVDDPAAVDAARERLAVDGWATQDVKKPRAARAGARRSP
jgi:hypothetical protein